MLSPPCNSPRNASRTSDDNCGVPFKEVEETPFLRHQSLKPAKHVLWRFLKIESHRQGTTRSTQLSHVLIVHLIMET